VLGSFSEGVIRSESLIRRPWFRHVNPYQALGVPPNQSGCPQAADECCITSLEKSGCGLGVVTLLTGLAA
jgi:hypothetical protein